MNPPDGVVKSQLRLTDRAERRRMNRTMIETEVTLTSESNFFAGISGDVSEGGVFVDTYQSLEVGQLVHVEFDVLDGRITAEGTVMWRRTASEEEPPGFGIAFDALGAHERSLIERFCATRRPLSHPEKRRG